VWAGQESNKVKLPKDPEETAEKKKESFEIIRLLPPEEVQAYVKTRIDDQNAVRLKDNARLLEELAVHFDDNHKKIAEILEGNINRKIITEILNDNINKLLETLAKLE